MRNQFLKIMQDLKVANVAQAPRIVFMKRFYEKLLEVGFNATVAANVVSGMKIDINEAFIKDEVLVTSSIEAYISILKQMEKELPGPLFFKCVESSGELTLTYQA